MIYFDGMPSRSLSDVSATARCMLVSSIWSFHEQPLGRCVCEGVLMTMEVVIYNQRQSQPAAASLLLRPSGMRYRVELGVMG